MRATQWRVNPPRKAPALKHIPTAAQVAQRDDEALKAAERRAEKSTREKIQKELAAQSRKEERERKHAEKERARIEMLRKKAEKVAEMRRVEEEKNLEKQRKIEERDEKRRREE